VSGETLETTVAEITARLRQGRFPNEQAISQGLVLRVLQELGWDTWDTTVVWPEYQTGEGRADFALCHPPHKPSVFIEVKQPGKAEDAVRQALEYAFHTGVPFTVLTDGRTWRFYLPAEQGTYEDRRVYKLDLFERPAAEVAETLVRYLAFARVKSGEALETARQEYRSLNRRTQARAAIPEAWNELVEKGDEDLVDLLANAVESKAGVRPEDDDVAEFLAELGKPVVATPYSNADQPPARRY
jgi:predicted type IV restriction endonuclease